MHSRLVGFYEGMPVPDRLYTALSEYFPGGVIALLDSAFRIMMIGGTELAAYDLHPSQLVNSLAEDILPPELYSTVIPHFAKALHGEAAEFAVSVFPKNYAVTATPLHDSDGIVRSILVVAMNQPETVEQQPLQEVEMAEDKQQMGEEVFRQQDEKAAEDKLQMDEESFQLILQATNDGIWDWNLTTNALLFSIRCGEMLGYSPDELPNTFSQWLSFVHSDDRQSVVTLLQAHCENGSPFTGIIRMLHKDGSIRWILKRGFSLKNDSGVPYRMVGSCTDMTEIRRHEEQHISNERRFRSLIQHSSDLTVVLDESATIAYQNPAFTHIFGMDGMPAQDFTALLHPDDLSAFHKHFEEVLQTHGHPRVFEGRYCCANGNEIRLESVCTNLLHDSSVQGIIINSRDVSARKRAEQQTRNLNSLLVGIIESTGTSIYSLDRELRYTAFNSSHKAAMKHILDADIELGHAFTEYTPAAQPVDAITTAFHEALSGERRTVNISYGNESNPTFNEVLINPIINDRHEVTGIAVFINDTTDRQLAQQQIRRANEELDTRVRERTTDLQRAMEQLNDALSQEKELSELKTRFVSMVSHEFRTPLTSILSSVEILERYRDRLNTEQQTRFFYMITESVRRMGNLLNDVILLGKAESNNIHFNPIRLFPDQYCRELLEELQNTLLKNRVVDCIVEGAMREVLVDPQLLRYILTNLLSNAAKYSPEQEPISLSVALGERSITFRVADRGIGIAPEDLRHIYEPFFRSEQVETIPGTGLGLSIVKQGVARHGGTVEVETNDKDGTTFTVRLPV